MWVVEGLCSFFFRDCGFFGTRLWTKLYEMCVFQLYDNTLSSCELERAVEWATEDIRATTASPGLADLGVVSDVYYASGVKIAESYMGIAAGTLEIEDIAGGNEMIINYPSILLSIYFNYHLTLWKGFLSTSGVFVSFFCQCSVFF